MGPINLSADAWMIVAAIAGFMVLLCLGILASTIEFEVGLKKLTEEVRSRRSRYAISPGRLTPPAPARESKEQS